jgi:hypothetical protein
MRLDLKDAERNQSRESPCNLTRRIKDTKSPSKLISLVESGEVEDDAGIEPRFSHTEEPPGRYNASKVDRRRTDHCHSSKDYHGNGQDYLSPKALGEHVHRRSGEHKRNVENRQQDVVLVALEMEVFCQPICFGISQVGLVDGASESQSD